jgi:hypothetical protein
MTRDDLVELWQSQEDGPPTVGEDILVEIRQRARSFDRSILWRDLREAAAALAFGVVAFVVAAPTGSPWPWLGALFVTACCAAVYLRLHRTRARHRSANEDLPLDARLRAEIAKVGAQEELLRSVGRWYMRPLILGAAVWMGSIGLAVPLAPGARAAASLFLAGVGALILLAVGKLVVWLNRQAADHHILPLRVELEELLARLEAV